MPPNLFASLRPGPESLRNGKEGQGLLETRTGLAEDSRARYTPAGRTSPGPASRRRPRSRWIFQQGRASGKQMPERPARPDTHLGSLEFHSQESQVQNPPFHAGGKHSAGLVYQAYLCLQEALPGAPPGPQPGSSWAALYSGLVGTNLTSWREFNQLEREELSQLKEMLLERAAGPEVLAVVKCLPRLKKLVCFSIGT